MTERTKIQVLILIILVIYGCESQESNILYQTDNLKIVKLTENSLVHISYLDTDDYGKVACNGMIVMDGGEAIVFDTPTNDSASEELINWIETQVSCKVIAVVATHFHSDCLGGINAFHKREITSYANNQTIELAKSANASFPQKGFDQSLEMKVGSKVILNAFFGEGHTKDNIVSYFPEDRVLFGGCLIKEEGAGKGYLGDANVNEWAITVKKIKSKFQNSEIVVPGHGNSGNQQLLDYTIELFGN